MNDRPARGWTSRPSIQAVLLAALLVASSTDSAQPGESQPNAGNHAVRMVNMQFEPADLVVKRGSRIVWINEDLFPHTATATDETFDSGTIAASSSWSYVATQPGTHVYVCALHPGMKGRLLVQ